MADKSLDELFQEQYGQKPTAPATPSMDELFQQQYGSKKKAEPSLDELFQQQYKQEPTETQPTSGGRFASSEDATEHALLPEFAKPVKTTVDIARDVFSGEAVPKGVNWLRHLFGDEHEKTGATVSRELDLERRGGGMLPEYRQLTGGPVDQTVQFLANAAGGVVGMVGAIPSLVVEGTTMLVQRLGQA